MLKPTILLALLVPAVIHAQQNDYAIQAVPFT